jgi:hypothetical protein
MFVRSSFRRATIYRTRGDGQKGDALLVRVDGDTGQAANAVRNGIARRWTRTRCGAAHVIAIRRDLADRFLRIVDLAVFLAAVARTREIGIRVALGATRGDVVTLLLWSGRAGFRKPGEVGRGRPFGVRGRHNVVRGHCRRSDVRTLSPRYLGRSGPRLASRVTP